jgi:hypothetical protein
MSQKIIDMDKANIHSVVAERTLCKNKMKSDIPVAAIHNLTKRSSYSSMKMNVPKHKTKWNILQRNVMTEMGGYRAVNDIIIQVNSYELK